MACNRSFTHVAKESIRAGTALALLIGALLAAPTFADLTPGALDPGFDPGTGTNNTVYATALQSDGRVLLAGSFTQVNGTPRPYIARLNADGTFDTTFDPGTGPNLLVYAVASQPDGKVLIGGQFTQVDGTAYSAIARLNADGTPDATFDPGTGANGPVRALVLQDNGRVLIAGEFTQVNGIARARVARLNRNGSLDTTFNPVNGPNDIVRAIARQSDGKVVIGGDFTQVGTTARASIARLNADGSLDTTFDPGSGANQPVYAVALHDHGQVVVGGKFTQVDGTARGYIARLNADGSLDTTFTPAANHYVYAAAVQSDGKVLIGGWFTQVDGNARERIARLAADGSVDPDFDSGSGAKSWVYCLTIQPNHQVVIGGTFTQIGTTARNHIARMNADGTLDIGFIPNPGADGEVLSAAVHPDGKAFIGGAFAQVDGTALPHLARLNADGTLDLHFDAGSGPNGDVAALALQPDGKVVIGGTFTQIDTTARGRIARLTAEGAVDGSFDPGTGANGIVKALALQADGKIVIGGTFTETNGTGRARIARLNADGSLDTTFDPGSGADQAVHALAIQGNGKVVIGGAFTQINGTARGRIARLNANGSLDTGFAPGTGANATVRALAIAPDGQIVIGGVFTQVNGSDQAYLARLQANGALDTAFTPTLDGPVDSVVLQADGKLVVGGEFNQVNTITRAGIARLNSDGTLDENFDPGSGTNGAVKTLVLYEDGRLLSGGAFTEIDSTPRGGIARLNAATAPEITSAEPPTLTTAGTPYSHTFTASGFPLPTFEVTGGALPPGLTLNEASGLLSGTPSTGGAYTFTLTVSNGVAPNVTQPVAMDNRVVDNRVRLYLPLVIRP